MDIPLTLLSTVRLNGSGAPVNAELKNGDSLSGKLAAAEISIDTLFGHVTIPLSEVLHIQVAGAARGKETFPNGLVLHYAFEVNDGEGVTDMTGNGNNGKIQGATFTSHGKPVGAMNFNGGQQLVVVGNPASLQLQDFSIVAWVKKGDRNRVAGGTGGDAAIFGCGQGGYILGVHPDGRLLLSKSGIDGVFSDCQIHDIDFHHIGVTKAGKPDCLLLGRSCFSGIGLRSRL